jgi:predicted TIM-barrel fold metal-dependent hydrolase
MDEGGIRQAIAIPGHNYNRADGIAATRRENDAIAAYRDRLADRFPVAAGVVEPLDEAAGLLEIDRMSNELGLKAISFHTEFQGVTIDSPWMMRYLERMGELGMVPLVHASNVVLHEAIWRLGKIARALPDLTIVAIEPFFTYDGMQECFFIADVAPNVVFESASCFDTDLMLELVRQFGAQRLVYGSQYYSQIHRAGEERAHERRCAAIRQDIVDTPTLDEREKALVLGGNARKILGLEPGASA